MKLAANATWFTSCFPVNMTAVFFQCNKDEDSSCWSKLAAHEYVVSILESDIQPSRHHISNTHLYFLNFRHYEPFLATLQYT
jgi:hypothetical protein